jgi:hypothetical protein
MGQSGEQCNDWYHHGIAEDLTALEALLQDAGSGPFCFGATPGLANICMVPQMANARRYKCPLVARPTLRRAETAALALPAFGDTASDQQPDAAWGKVRCRSTGVPAITSSMPTLHYFKWRSHSAKIFVHVVSDASVSYTARSGKQKP